MGRSRVASPQRLDAFESCLSDDVLKRLIQSSVTDQMTAGRGLVPCILRLYFRCALLRHCSRLRINRRSISNSSGITPRIVKRCLLLGVGRHLGAQGGRLRRAAVVLTVHAHASGTCRFVRLTNAFTTSCSRVVQ